MQLVVKKADQMKSHTQTIKWLPTIIATQRKISFNKWKHWHINTSEKSWSECSLQRIIDCFCVASNQNGRKKNKLLYVIEAERYWRHARTVSTNYVCVSVRMKIFICDPMWLVARIHIVFYLMWIRFDSRKVIYFPLCRAENQNIRLWFCST